MIKLSIHSVPRSGSTWLGTIFDSHPKVSYKSQPLFSYAYKGYLNENSSRLTINKFFDEIQTSKDPYLNQTEWKQKKFVPDFKKNNFSACVYKEVRYHHVLENILEKAPDVKIIGLIRNPISVIHSWLNAPKEFKKELGWKEEDEWRFAPSKNLNKAEEFNGYEKWKEVALLFEKFKKKYPTQFLLLTYQDLLENPTNEVKKTFDFAGLTFPKQTENYIHESRNIQVDDAYSVYKNKKSDNEWEGQLDNYIVEHINDDLKGSNLEKYLS